MKKIILMILAGLMICLCGCSAGNAPATGKLKSEEDFFSENAYNGDAQQGETSAVASALKEYSGTWYGYGTDSTEAVTTGRTLTFPGGSRIEFNGEAFVLIDKDVAESVSDYDSSSGKQDSKIILVFGRDGNGEHALESYMINKSDRKQLSESMYYYRQTSRSNYQDFIKGAEQVQITPPEKPAETSQTTQTKPKTETVNYAKIGFQERYDTLCNKEIADGPQMEMNISSGELYAEWDLLLNEVYQYLKKTKSSSAFKVIKDNEQKWIKQKETAVDNEYNSYQGGSMAPLAANSVAIQYTRERCRYLISLID